MTDHRWEWRHIYDAEDDWKSLVYADNSYDAAEQAAYIWDPGHAMAKANSPMTFHVRDTSTGRVYDFRVVGTVTPYYVAKSLSEDH